MAEQQQDVDALKRRGRRRLVGAVALVLLAVIVLPMVFDPEPRRSVPPVSVRIPGEDDSAFAPRAPSKPQPPQPPAIPEVKQPERAAKVPAKGDKDERARAEAAISGAEYVVPVGAYQNAERVIARLSGAKIPHYTESAPGNLTRVRAGPFATKEAADKAAERLKALGLKPGPATSRSE